MDTNIAKANDRRDKSDEGKIVIKGVEILLSY